MLFERRMLFREDEWPPFLKDLLFTKYYLDLEIGSLDNLCLPGVIKLSCWLLNLIEGRTSVWNWSEPTSVDWSLFGYVDGESWIYLEVIGYEIFDS